MSVEEHLKSLILTPRAHTIFSYKKDSPSQSHDQTPKDLEKLWKYQILIKKPSRLRKTFKSVLYYIKSLKFILFLLRV